MLRKRVSVLSLMWAAVLLAAGCHGSESPTTAPSASATPQRAVIITAGNGTTYLYVPSAASSTGVARLAGDKETAGAPVCKQCEEDAENYIKYGTPIPTKCSVCGASRTPLHSIN